MKLSKAICLSRVPRKRYFTGVAEMRRLCSFLLIQLFSFVSSDTVDVPLKVSVIDQFGEQVLHKCRNRAGIESELFLEGSNEVLGKYHITDSERGRDRFGEGIQIDHIIPVRERKQCFRRLGGNGKFRFKIILDDIAVSLLRPTDVLVEFGGGCGYALG